MKNVIIVNKKDLEKKKKEIAKGGADKLHILSDFDRTITYGLTGEGKRTATVISQLRSDSKYLGKDYQKKAHEMFDFYRPIEINPKISLDEKKKKMHEWWMKHYNLIAEVGFTKKLIKKVVDEKPLQFRKGSLEFLSLLNKKNIPIIFMSAAPGDMLIEYLRKNNILFSQVYVVANLYNWDKNGNALNIIEPIIHSMNKDETSIQKFPVYDKIIKRKNVILLGDEIEDVGMVEGFDYDNLIKVGFLNENIKENIEHYKKNFDVVLINDTDMSYVNKLLKEIVK
jgi:5'-nucleotidase